MLSFSIFFSYDISSAFNNLWSCVFNHISWACFLSSSSFHTIFYQLSTISHFFSILHAALCIQCKLNFIAPLKSLQCETVHLSLAFLRALSDLNTSQQRKFKIRTLSAQIQALNQQKKHSRLLLHHSVTAVTALSDTSWTLKQILKAFFTHHCLQPHKHSLYSALKN